MVTNDANAAAGPRNGSIDDIASRDRPGFRYGKDLPDLRPAQHPLLECRFQEPFHGGPNIGDGIVNNRVQPDIDAFSVGQARSFWFGSNIEADDDGPRG